jgi:hypothetical protein
MTIECYYSECKYHGAIDDGPFCYEADCRATQKELQQFEMIRQAYLESINLARNERKEKWQILKQKL